MGVCLGSKTLTPQTGTSLPLIVQTTSQETSQPLVKAIFSSVDVAITLASPKIDATPTETPLQRLFSRF